MSRAGGASTGADVRPLTAADMVEVWDRGQGLSPVRRGLLLLEASSPYEPVERLAALPVGRRDARLLALRARTLGPRLDSVTRCPTCHERLELELRSDDLWPEPDDSEPPPRTLSLHHEGYEVLFRLPTSRDLIEAGDGDDADVRLLAACVIEATRGDDPVEPDTLPEAVVVRLAETMADADPLADIQLALDCPACGHEWSLPFDPLAFFWSEIDQRVPRILGEVHRLASAYGWTEGDILAMSGWRRGHYLQLVEATT
jgi:hypothetical protein